ncbi:hypothetical protein C9374_013273 [Naegleria lovaniensis]|uniref:START domain-containing protein n=1 Tax=Naegleria lovaniensis TaxID=51637 RepID=A0AA88GVH1_NAELO|nr:uncharacterized protein C9374_013273 [Naegleria lovaniensis]KAG2391788.1 hypothetical protein C9374_013273 [Naegleria lovaniensis]
MNKQEIKQKWQQALTLAQSFTPDKFKFYEQKDHVVISSCEDPNGTVVMGQLVIEKCTAAEYLQVIQTTELKTWVLLDPKAKEYVELDSFEDQDGHYSIRYYIGASPNMMVSDRDFIICLHIHHDDQVSSNRYIVVTTSVDGSYTSDLATSHGVRGTNIFSYHELVETEHGDLQVVFKGQASANGWIPTAVANQVVYGRPLIIAAVAKYLGKSTRSV